MYRETWERSKIKLTPWRFEKGFKNVIFKLNFLKNYIFYQKKEVEKYSGLR